MLNIYFAHINSQSKIDFNQFSHSLLNLSYSEKKGFGFKNCDLDKNYLEATLVQRNNTFIKTYNQKNQTLEKKQISIFTEIDFMIDNDFKLMGLFNHVKKFTQLKSILNSEFNTSFEGNIIPLLPIQTLTSIFKVFPNYNINSFFIQNFKFNQDTIGTYNVKLSNNQTAFFILEKYKSDVKKVKLEIESTNFGTFYLELSATGKLSIKAKKEFNTQLLTILKKSLFTKS